ncbi:MAPEG family protein [Pseudomonas sp. Leaf58]|uniref:MAPEG family protein n=1 Tax=Pseudomonas TaxID=286 RepID=UPI0006F1D9E9|nr:MAPEG family protein [Pseudomonas sp. Leaf58]AYG45473.1 MAPEG family protein [Pseudomonas sp. Leaf58]KQN61600.1 glutathione metabolism protein [Pseudomonas sp. Leaf58]
MNDMLCVYALCVVVLFLKMFGVSCYQGYHRLRFVAFTNPEDAAVFKRAAQLAERPQVARAGRVWANDLENIPAFFALGGLAIALDAPAAVSAWLSIVFTLTRVLHTCAYLAGVQPWRTVCYGVGVLCLLGFCVVITATLLN